ncbi:MAG: hypothetical protein U5K38_16675 [Woeseiaceae bacterium]|nr:hypothetical protein [Woeseiaceae bacterium]
MTNRLTERHVLRRGKEPHTRPALQRFMLPDRAAQHRVACFERIKDRTLRDRAVDIEFYLAVDARKQAQVMRQRDTYHDSV